MARTAYDDLADRLRQLVHETAPRQSLDRGRVVQANPLLVDMGDDVLLDERDPDVEVDRAVLADRPAVGDTVRVHHDGQDYVVAGVVS